MGTRCAIRVQKGQAAAVHGLILCGLRYLDACNIVGVWHRKMDPYVRPDWRRGRHPKSLRSLPSYQRKVYEILRPTIGRERAYLEATRTKRKRPNYVYSGAHPPSVSPSAAAAPVGGPAPAVSLRLPGRE